jgi:hypothetical protein
MIPLRQSSGGHAPLTYTFTDLTAALQLGTAKTARARLAAFEAHGFPKALPGHGHKLWSKPQVDAWLANWGSYLSSPAICAGEGARRADEGTPPQNITTITQQLEAAYFARKTA